jgi:hypothetical protein
MRTLIIAAATAGALALPSAAAADTTTASACVTPVIPCVQEAVDTVVHCTVGHCLPPLRPVVDRVVREVDQACETVFGTC